MSQYLPNLVQFARELPQLQHDMQNASTQNTLWSVTQKLFNILSYMLHHAIIDAYSNMPAGNPEPAAVPAASPAPSPIAPAPVIPIGALPFPPTITQPGLAPTQVPGMPDIAPSGVTEVIVTAQGTKVIPAGGAGPAIVLPPNVAVDASHLGKPEPPAAPPGVAQVILPEGGVLPPDVAAALASRGT